MKISENIGLDGTLEAHPCVADDVEAHSPVCQKSKSLLFPSREQHSPPCTSVLLLGSVWGTRGDRTGLLSFLVC